MAGDDEVAVVALHDVLIFERFRIEQVPTLLVIESRAVRARLVEPRGSAEITLFLSPWLR